MDIYKRNILDHLHQLIIITQCDKLATEKIKHTFVSFFKQEIINNSNILESKQHGNHNKEQSLF